MLLHFSPLVQAYRLCHMWSLSKPFFSRTRVWWVMHLRTVAYHRRSQTNWISHNHVQGICRFGIVGSWVLHYCSISSSVVRAYTTLFSQVLHEQRIALVSELLADSFFCIRFLKTANHIYMSSFVRQSALLWFSIVVPVLVADVLIVCSHVSFLSSWSSPLQIEYLLP